MIASFVAALVLAAVHLSAGHLRRLPSLPRRRWLSAAGGVSVAYVFIHLLPELARGQEVIAGSDLALVSFFEHHAYLLALFGLVGFYGLEHTIKQHRQQLDENQQSHAGIFWLHVGSFALYNGLIGYLLVHGESDSLINLTLYCVAMGLHYLVNDYALQSEHKALFSRRGRWILSAMPLMGWALGIMTEVSEAAVSALTAFIGGSIILNVLKEELPAERNSRIGAFVFGAVGYSVLLLILHSG